MGNTALKIPIAPQRPNSAIRKNDFLKIVSCILVREKMAPDAQQFHIWLVFKCFAWRDVNADSVEI